ncbi:MAG: hypothetical protein SGPRY_001836 [Prymnesium sp.]
MQEKRALHRGERTVFISSLNYGGSDQLSVSTVHLARELNVFNLACAALSSSKRPSPCPLAFVAPVVRDLTETAKQDAMYLFSEPSRRDVLLGSLFDLEVMRSCSRVRIVPSLASLQRGGSTVLRTHLVLPISTYAGPVLSHTNRATLLTLLHNTSFTKGSQEQLAILIRTVNKTTNKLLAAASRHADRGGVKLRVERYTILADPPKSGPTPEWNGGPEHNCTLPGAPSARPIGCGAALLHHVVKHEPNGTLVLFIVTESSQQGDIPSRKSYHRFWLPAGPVSRALSLRYRVDERAVMDCLRLAPRFDQAVEKMLEMSNLSTPILTWQVRAEKLSLAGSRKRRGSTSFWELLKSIHSQAHTVHSSAAACRVRSVIFESDLLRPSATMLRTMVGSTAINTSISSAQVQQLRGALLSGLASSSKGTPRSPPIRTTTADSLLLGCRGSVPRGHALEPFTRSDTSLLNVERTLFAVNVMARTDYLIRSPITSSFSGWANAIRLARGGPSKASWGTDDGKKWWKCNFPSHVKLGKCRRPSTTSRVPRLCTSPTSAMY